MSLKHDADDEMFFWQVIEAKNARIQKLEEALRKIACWHVTEGPLWWQSVARAALATGEKKDAENG